MVKKNWPASVLMALLTFVALLPSGLTLEQHGDEQMRTWKAAYYAQLLLNGDMRSKDPRSYTDPGMAPLSVWAYEQPWGSHMIYAAAIWLTDSTVQPLPYSYEDPTLQGPDTLVPQATLRVLRLTAIACASLGLGLIALRLGWPVLLGGTLFLAIPHVRADLCRAWAEGPLLLGFGLCAIAYGTTWFPVAAGLATGFKLTGLALWPIVWFKGPIPFRRVRHVANIVVTMIVFSLTTPCSWLAGGPLYIGIMIVYRVLTYAQQSSEFGGRFGLFIPTRYLWPIELASMICLSQAAFRRLNGLH